MMRFTKKGGLLPYGGVGDIDDDAIFYAAPFLFHGKVYVYYSGSDGTNPRIALAVSHDGMNFVKKGTILSLGAGGEIDDVHQYGPCVLEGNGKFYLYYTSQDGSVNRVALAISRDGMNYEKQGVMLPLGAGDEIDDAHTHYARGIQYGDKMAMYYTGADGSTYRSALSFSNDRMRFEKKGIIDPLGAGGEIDDSRIYHPAIIKINRKNWIYYSAYDGSKWRIALSIGEQ